jgi:diguanylate cyclase
MHGIETSVHGAANLAELKAAIQERLDHIKAHFEEHRQTEEEQQAALQSQLKKATSRLSVLEGETGRLRTHLQAQQLQATMDALTNLPNRLAYDARLEREYARWKRHKTPLTLLVLDVDRFKQINDTYGHKAGDKALKLIAFVLKQTVRETDFIARYGGEEFVAIIADTPTAAAVKVAEKMRASVEAADFHHNKQKVAITVSVGISSFRDADTADMVFLRADKALYRAKSLGRNRCVDDSSLQAAGDGI